MAGQRVAPPYPKDLHIKYPKVGEKNPTVTLHLLEVNNPSPPRKVDFQTYAPDDLIITEVAWVAEKHERVIFRTQNRVQDREKLVLIDVESGDTKVVRERDGTDGWLDSNHAITCELSVCGCLVSAEKSLTPLVRCPRASYSLLCGSLGSFRLATYLSLPSVGWRTNCVDFRKLGSRRSLPNRH